MWRVAGASSCQPGRSDAGAEGFYEDLRGFFVSTGQKVSSLPHFNGKPLQLVHLYNAVVSRGGWQKVGQQNGWEDVAHATGTPKPCANAGHALKAVYYQYLLKYECAKFNRAPVEDIYEEDDIFKRFSLNGPGFSRIPDYLRASCGLSSDLKEEDAFEKVHLSLSSGLPNEVDFAINAILVRSADLRRPFMLTPNRMTMMESLVAAVGIFADHPGHYIGPYNSFIGDTDKDFVRYWKETIEDQELWEFFEVDNSYEQPLTNDAFVSDLFSEIPSVGSNEIRITQIATIFLNLALDDMNANFLAGNTVCLRFSLLCANSIRNAVFELGLQLMTQLSVKIDLPSRESWVQSGLLKTVQRCIGSPDRLRHLLGLSLVASICELDSRRSCLNEALDEVHCSTLSRNLSVPDAPIVIFSLEVLYKLSGLGDAQASLIAQNSCNIDFLVRLLSLSSELIETVVWDNNSSCTDQIFAAQPATPKTLIASNSPPTLPPVSQQESEETVNWFRKIFDEDESYAMSMSDVYKDYASFCLVGKKFAPVLPAFTHCYQLAFPKARTASYNLGGKVELCIAGIKRRNPIPEKSSTPNHVVEPKMEVSSCGSILNGHLSHRASISPLTVLSSSSETTEGAVANDSKHEDSSNGSEKRQKKTSESSLIRSLLATKISRKQSTGSNDSHAANSNHCFDDWRTPVEPDRLGIVRSDPCQLSDGIFSDLESNDSLLMTPPAPRSPTKGSRRRSPSTASDVSVRKRKPAAKRKKKDVMEPNELETGLVNGNSNGDSHLSYDSTSGATTPIVVPYVLPEPKPVKKVRGQPVRVNGDSLLGEALLNGEVGGPLSGGGGPPSGGGKSPAKKPRRSARKPKPGDVEPDSNGLLNGHGEDGAAELSLVEKKKPLRKAAKRKPKMKTGDAVVEPVVVDSIPLNENLPGQTAPDDHVLTFICEWDGCQRVFPQNAGAVFRHNFHDHVPSAVEGCCRWPNCNGIKRQSLSLITHLNETHCSPNELLRQAIRRQEIRRNGTSSVPSPIPVAPPVAYSEHAALHSIQARYGSAVASDFAPEVESSNTRTLRLTAALVLRNISHFSHVGRIKLYKYEHVLTISAMQQSEASHIVGECLYYLAVHRRDGDQF